MVDTTTGKVEYKFSFERIQHSRASRRETCYRAGVQISAVLYSLCVFLAECECRKNWLNGGSAALIHVMVYIFFLSTISDTV